jgi:membrane-bound inhibitor of C-type lysozyme
MVDLRSLIAGGIFVLIAGPALAQDAPAEAEPTPPLLPNVTANLTLTLDATSDIERRTVVYQCDNGEGFRVQYVNAAPNFLAILPIEGETHIFATTISASGARYVSGPYEWWNAGDEATLRDLRSAEDEPALATCLAAGNAP